MDNSNDTGSEYELERTVKNIKNQDKYSVRYESLIPFLVSAIKELSSEIDTLKSEIEKMKK